MKRFRAEVLMALSRPRLTTANPNLNPKPSQIRRLSSGALVSEETSLQCLIHQCV